MGLLRLILNDLAGDAASPLSDNTGSSYINDFRLLILSGSGDGGGAFFLAILSSITLLLTAF